ncbi:uncharacterized protein LOC141858138 [Brevipalpus obovatus]|uniref:uncharacterized protein LOC141858138 n=1 Tax=Brevipalpus obovatus TaxID=246614 RepID=UPI003D9EC200
MDAKADCSFCVTSNPDSSSSEFNENDSLLDNECTEWIHDSCDSNGNLMYLKALKNDPITRSTAQQNDYRHNHHRGERNNITFSKSSKRSSYFKLSQWVSEERKSKTIALKQSLKRNWKQLRNSTIDKNGVKSLDDKDIEDSAILKNENEDDPLKDSFLDLVKKGCLDMPIKGYKPFLVLYLASPNDNNHAKDYAVFVYPKPVSEDAAEKLDDSEASNESAFNRLVKLKGMFVSLSQVVNEITGQLPILSKVDVYAKESCQNIDHHQLDIEDRTFNVGFVQEFNSNLVIALPEDEYSETETIALTATLGRTFRFLYNSLDSAFKNPNNHNKIEFMLEILRHLLLEAQEEGSLSCYVDMTQKLILEDDLLLAVDEVLNEYESMDWLSDQCVEENGTISSSCDFLILGSALFYRKYLISSHLSSRYLSDVISFIKLRGILSLIEHQSVKLVLWQEVFPSYQSNDHLAANFKENEGSRFFLMCIAVEFTLLCTILEMPFISIDPNVKPNEMIITQTLRFVVSSLNRSGLILEISRHLTFQNHLNIKNFSQSSWKDSKIKDFTFAEELNTLSLNSYDSDDSDDLSSEPGSVPSSLSRTSSSLQSSSTGFRHPYAPTITHHNQKPQYSSSSANASILDRTFTSLRRSDLDSEQSKPFINFPPELNFYAKDFRFRLSEYLLFYLDFDLKSRFYFAPTKLNERYLPKIPSLCWQLKNCCIYVSDQLNLYGSDVHEFATHLIFDDDSIPIKERSKIAAKYWIVGRKYSPNREIFLIFRFSLKDKSDVNINMESIFQRLALGNR